MSNPCDGNRIYQTYLEYQKQFEDLTPAEFLAIILMAEANGADTEFLESITLATSSQLWGTSNQHEAYCKTSNCEEGIFNFIGAYMEAGTRRYNTILYEKDPEKIKELMKTDQAAIEYFNKNGISISQIVNDTIYDPVSTTYSNNTPTQWGNFGCGENCDYLGPNWIKEANQTDIQTGTTNVCGIYDLVGQGDSLGVVFTENQKYNWSVKNPECFPK